MMLSRIQQLPPVVANQIAAGEVIERPASIVKELLENALDAEADAINIEIGFGGLNQVKVSDNGIGIVAEDLSLAVAAHATSKIKQLNDLYAITSMGFRGEALASIASVSKLVLSSKPAEQEHAMMLHYDNGVFSVSPCARTQGTTVDVRDIFFNAPVRKKFLKTARSEYQAIEMVVKRFALSASHVALTLKHDGKPLLVLPPATCEKTRLLRLRKLLGKEFVERAIYLDIEQGGMRLHGWVSGQTYERSQNDKQWVYINQRMVKDKLINHALKQAYDGLLHPGRHPACVLYLTIPAELVDINVHPTKHEVRFQQPRLVHDFILSQLSQALTKPEVAIPEKREFKQEIRETYIKQPLRALASTQKVSFDTTNWVILNQGFAIVFIHEKPYLVDIERISQQNHLAMLKQQALPLASRPLLVPIKHKLTNLDQQMFEPYQLLLAQLGIQLDWVEDETVVIRTLPTSLPQLDIKKFLQHVIDTAPVQTELLELLVTCQSVDAYQLTQEAKIELGHYLQQQMQLTSSLPWCRYLDAEKCREFVHV